MKLDEMTSRFIHSEGKFVEPNLRSHMQALEEILNNLQGRSTTESRRIEIAKEQLKGIRRQSRKLEEKLVLAENENKQLQERLSILEETKREE